MSDGEAPRGEYAATSDVGTIRALLRDPKSVTDLFHVVHRLLPPGRSLLTVPAEATAGYALEVMRANGYSQLPVKRDARVIGLFTFRAFALEVASMAGTADARRDPTLLPVSDFLDREKTSFATMTDEFQKLIEDLDRSDAVVVSGPDRAIALLTPMDVLNYLYSVASPFVLVQEIELSLRELLRAAIPDVPALADLGRRILTAKYGAGKVPETLEEMTFSDYVCLVRDGRAWPLLEPVLRGSRERRTAKLDRVSSIRNAVFHFKGALSAEDHEHLTGCRAWLLQCVDDLERAGRVSP
jgi:CBS domain-containing protein